MSIKWSPGNIHNTLTDEERYEPEIPPLQGEYAKTLFLWCVSKPQPIHYDDGYAGYLLYECGIRDCIVYHKKMVAEGYLTEAAPEDALNLFKVPELKEILRKLGQPVSGKKEKLIEHILENADDGFITELFPETIYSLSLKGQTWLQEHGEYIELHRHKGWQISWKEYDKYAKPGQDFLSVSLIIMKDRLKAESLLCSRNTYYNLYQILLEQGKRSDALEMLLKVLYLDCSGILENTSFDFYRQRIYTKERLKERAESYAFLAPGIVHSLKQFSDYYDPDMIDLLYKWELPIQVCSKELFLQIAEDAVSDTWDEEEIRRKLRIAFEDYVDNL